MKRIGLLALTLTVLAGCAAPMPMPGRTPLPAANARVGALDLSSGDASAVIRVRTEAAVPGMLAGLPAILAAPTDTIAQRGLQNLYSDMVKRVTPTIDPIIDTSISNEVIRETKQEVPPVTDKPELLAYLQGIADRLAKAANVEPFTVHLVDVPEANAFNAGGNAMVIFTGLLTSVKDEAELAGVMAHEMIHGLHRHVVKGSVVEAAGEYAAAWVANNQPVPAEEQKLMTAFVLSLPPHQRADYDFAIGYLQGKVGKPAITNYKFDVDSYFAYQTLSRSFEAESDKYGARMVSAAGYDPHGLARVFDRWNTWPGGDVRYFSHPDLGQRIAAIRAVIEAEGLDKGRKEKGVERFKQQVSVLTAGGGPGLANLSKKLASRLCWHRVEPFEPRLLRSTQPGMPHQAAAAQLGQPATTVSAMARRF